MLIYDTTTGAFKSIGGQTGVNLALSSLEPAGRFEDIEIDFSKTTMPVDLNNVEYIMFNGSKLSPTDAVLTDTVFAIPEGVYISEYYFSDNTAILHLK